MGKFVRRVEPAGDDDRDVRLFTDAQFTAQYPALWEYLAEGLWDDGGVRETATLLVFCEAGQWKGCLNDRANSRSAWVSAATFWGLLGALEGKLEQDEMEWRRSQVRGRKGR